MKNLDLAIAASALAMGIVLFLERGIKRGCQRAIEDNKTSTVAKKLLK